MYSDVTGVMTPDTATWFIKGATNETVQADDNRIKGLFAQYNKKKDGKMLREEFLTFYLEASLGKPERVHDNLKNHFIRLDLRKMSEIDQQTAYKKTDMPRLTMTTNQE